MNLDEKLELLLTGKITPRPEPELDPLIPIARFARLRGVTMRSVERWLRLPGMNLPPIERVCGRRYMRLSAAIGWEPPAGSVAARADDEAQIPEPEPRGPLKLHAPEQSADQA